MNALRGRALWLLACLGAAAACGAAAAEPAAAPQALRWQLPCTFKRLDGAIYSKSEGPEAAPAPVPYYECDYIRAQDSDALRNFDFNMRPREQADYLKQMRAPAAAALKTYNIQKFALLNRTDPKAVEAVRDPEARVDRLLLYKKELLDQEGSIAAPFERASTRAYPPVSGPLSSYRQEFFDREQALEEVIKRGEKGLSAEQQARVAQVAARFDAETQSVAAAQLKSAARRLAGDGTDKARLDALFAGAPPQRPASAGSAPRLEANRSPAGVVSPDTVERKYSAAPEPPPAPTAPLTLTQSIERRGYFESSDETGWKKYKDPAGWRRIKDDAQIAWWHATGQSRTVGDPDGKLRYAYEQSRDGTCAIAAQRMALEARGVDVTEDALAREAAAKGYYAPVTLQNSKGGVTEYRNDETPRGTPAEPIRSPAKAGSSATLDYRLYDAKPDAGGTAYEYEGALARDHGFKVTSVDEADAGQLQASLRRNGDAIIGVDSGSLYNNTAFSAGDHDIYVTGMEVNRSGKVLGYYINDSGTGEGKRYLPAANLENAWDGMLVTISQKRRAQP